MGKRVPIVKHNCDDFSIKYGSEEYFPHEGEDVWFVPYLSTPDMIKMVEFSNVEEEDTLRALSSEICPVIAKVIDSWQWTHVITGESIGGKAGTGRFRPSGEELAELSYQEIMYLVDSFFTEINTEENPPSASSD